VSTTYDDTSGSDTRGPRPVMERLMVFSLFDEVESLRQEPQWTDGERNSRMLAKDVDFRVLLTCLRAGATLDEKDGDGRVSIQVLEGTVALTLGDVSSELTSGDLAAIDRGNPWQLTARTDASLLLTLAWPEEKAFV
jgi:quercetin dioxygenase-like cupin family protein